MPTHHALDMMWCVRVCEKCVGILENLDFEVWWVIDSISLMGVHYEGSREHVKGGRAKGA